MQPLPRCSLQADACLQATSLCFQTPKFSLSEGRMGRVLKREATDPGKSSARENPRPFLRARSGELQIQGGHKRAPNTHRKIRRCSEKDGSGKELCEEGDANHACSA